MTRPSQDEQQDRAVGISAVVCSCNEAAHLPACLAGLAFCDERIVIDLESTDGTAEVAEACGARVVRHRRVPVVELVRRFAAEQAAHDWIVFFDPDMVIPVHRGGEIRRFITEHADAGRLWAFGRNYVLGRPIRHGRWGGRHRFLLALHRRRVEFATDVHQGTKLLGQFGEATLPPGHGEADLVKHDWVTSMRQMIEKHRRYARQEGPTRYAGGERFAWRSAIGKTIHQFKRSLIWTDGWRDGPTGVFLSAFWSWYTWACLWSLRRAQRQARAGVAERSPDSAATAETLDRRRAA